MTMFLRAGGLLGIVLCQGDGSRGLVRASGEKALVSSGHIPLTCVGSLVIFPVVVSRIDERFVNAVFFFDVRSGF